VVVGSSIGVLLYSMNGMRYNHTIPGYYPIDRGKVKDYGWGGVEEMSLIDYRSNVGDIVWSGAG